MAVRRRFPPPWSVEGTPGGYRVVDASGFTLAYVYCRDDKAAAMLGYLTEDEARRIAKGIARLPELLQSPQSG